MSLTTDPAYRHINYFHQKLAGRRLAKNIETGLYRIVQEAIHNAVKYASISEINVDLSIKKKYIHLKIDNDGVTNIHSQ